jgi:hypothetical protein
MAVLVKLEKIGDTGQPLDKQGTGYSHWLYRASVEISQVVYTQQARRCHRRVDTSYLMV